MHGASEYLPLGKRRYDEETDTLTLGEVTDTQAWVVENGDLVVHWGPDGYGGFDPTGVVLRRAQAYFGKLQPVGG